MIRMPESVEAALFQARVAALHCPNCAKDIAAVIAIELGLIMICAPEKV